MNFKKHKKFVEAEGGVEDIEGASVGEIERVKKLLEGGVEMSPEEVKQMKEQYSDLQDKIQYLQEKSVDDVSYTISISTLSVVAFVLGAIIGKVTGQDTVAGGLMFGGLVGVATSTFTGPMAADIIGETVKKAKVAWASLKAGNLQKKLATVEA